MGSIQESSRNNANIYVNHYINYLINQLPKGNYLMIGNKQKFQLYLKEKEIVRKQATIGQ